MSVYGRIGRFIGKLWGLVRHLLSIRTLLDILGLKEGVIAAAGGVALGLWAWAVNLPGPVAALMGIIAFGIVVLALGVWRQWDHLPGTAQARVGQTEQESVEPTLEFGLIHAGTWESDAFAQSIVVDIKNIQTAVANTAKNTSARIQFVHDDGTTFTVISAAWLIENTAKGGTIQGGIGASADLEGGEEQPFVLLLIKKKDRSVWAFRNLDAPVGVCGVGHWTAHVRIISDNAKMLEGSIGFSVFRGNSLQFDQPTAFLSRSDR